MYVLILGISPPPDICKNALNLWNLWAGSEMHLVLVWNCLEYLSPADRFRIFVDFGNIPPPPDVFEKALNSSDPWSGPEMQLVVVWKWLDFLILIRNEQVRTLSQNVDLKAWFRPRAIQFGSENSRLVFYVNNKLEYVQRTHKHTHAHARTHTRTCIDTHAHTPTHARTRKQ